MTKIKKLIKDNWADPVWSKVIAGLILIILGGFGTFVIALCKKIPISEIYTKSTNSYVTISYFTIFISVVILFAIIIPAIASDLIKFQLKKIKFPTQFNTTKFDLQNFLTGQWTLIYTSVDFTGKEPVSFINGNQYYIGENLTFVMTDIKFDENKKELIWTKTQYATNQKHACEALKIIDNKTMQGSDELGFTLTYTKT